MTSSPLSDALVGWRPSNALATQLSARLPYAYLPDDGGGAWGPTRDVLPELLGWPPEWEACVEEVQVRADAPCPQCTFLDIHGRDPRHPQVVLGTTVAVSEQGAW